MSIKEQAEKTVGTVNKVFDANARAKGVNLYKARTITRLVALPITTYITVRGRHKAGRNYWSWRFDDADFARTGRISLALIWADAVVFTLLESRSRERKERKVKSDTSDEGQCLECLKWVTRSEMNGHWHGHLRTCSRWGEAPRLRMRAPRR